MDAGSSTIIQNGDDTAQVKVLIEEESGELQNNSTSSNAPRKPVRFARGESFTGEIPITVDVTWQDLSYTVKKNKQEKQILKSCNGYVQSGQLLAIMGPSGSGKTTMLDALSGRLGTKGKLSGSVLFNGQKLNQSTKRRVVSYVSQEDSLHGNFTVWETVMFAIRFHYGHAKSTTYLTEKAETIISNMGLTSARNTIVGDIFRKGLSGGQKRRLSIAVELVSSPAVIYLDEPTSGLDSSSAYGVMKELRMLSSCGHTIVTTIHQPSTEVWTLFDQFLMVSEGNTVYFGAACSAIDYFSGIGFPCPQYSNPADFFISLVNTDFLEVPLGFEGEDKEHDSKEQQLASLVQSYKESPEMSHVRAVLNGDEEMGSSQALVLDGDDSMKNEREALRKISSQKLKKADFAKEGATWLSSFLTLSHRNLLNNLRNPGIYWVRFVMYTMLCLMIGLMYLDLGEEYDSASIQSRTGLLFFVCAFLVFMSVAVLPFVIQERAYFVRERTNGAYGVSAYVLANWLCSLPGLAIISVVSSACVVFPAQLNNFGYFFLSLFVSLLTAESFMFLVASMVPHYIIGIAMGAGAFGMFMIAQGFFKVTDEIPDWFIWLHYIGFHTYAFRAFMVGEFEPIDHFDDPRFANGQEVLDFYLGKDNDRPLEVDLVIVLAFGVLFQILFSFVLWKYHTGQR